MKDLLNNQLGKILLGIAILWCTIYIYSNGSVKLPDDLFADPPRDVTVELDKQGLAAVSAETYFSFKINRVAADTDHDAFVPEKKVVVFVPVELDIPPSHVMRPPRLLPDPGPSLEGSQGLPRWGDEFLPANPGKGDEKTAEKPDKTPASP